ncbi:MAG: hypothetical protein Q8P67_14850 [archaeon]|nr:hypothetical protein [archaeon]
MPSGPCAPNPAQHAAQKPARHQSVPSVETTGLKACGLGCFYQAQHAQCSRLAQSEPSGSGIEAAVARGRLVVGLFSMPWKENSRPPEEPPEQAGCVV